MTLLTCVAVRRRLPAFYDRELPIPDLGTSGRNEMTRRIDAAFNARESAANAEHEAIRMIGNLATPAAALAPPELIRTVGIGSRVRAVFASAGPDIAIPLWTLDEGKAAVTAWRYPEPSN